jgi:hypothetical protein
MAERETPALHESKPSSGDSGDYDPHASPFREPEMEWVEPGPDVWGFLERVWRRVKRADKAA